MRATSTIPIVLPIVGDPVAAGLVSSLARPGGNVTGLSMLNTEISSKRVELLRDLLPKIERVAVLRDPTVARRIGTRLKRLPAASDCGCNFSTRPGPRSSWTRSRQQQKHARKP